MLNNVLFFLSSLFLNRFLFFTPALQSLPYLFAHALEFTELFEFEIRKL
jgi:hypothetical protein